MTQEHFSHRNHLLALVMTTLPDRQAAETLVHQMVEERIAACGNLMPGVSSIYRWEGKVVTETEVLVLLKTTRDNLDRLFDRLLEVHPYDVPEIVEVGAGRIAEPYLEWVTESTRTGG